MGYDNRDYSRGRYVIKDSGGGGGFMDWSFQLFRIFGIRVKIHWTFVIYAIIEIARASDWRTQAMFMAMLFGFVLLHEFGHSLACRSVGGLANRIILWPLGGLAECDPPLRPAPALWTTVCGPLVNVALMGLFASVLLLTAHSQVELSIHPLKMAAVAYDAPSWVHWLVDAYMINYGLFLFNVCFACYPMDGGRILQELMWFKLGYPRSLYYACFVAMLLASGLAILAFLGHLGPMAFPIAFMCLITSGSRFFQLRRLKEAAGGSWEYVVDPTEPAPIRMGGRGNWFQRWRHDRQRDKIQRADAALAAHREEVDRILAKIAREGMGALTYEEKATLKKSTEQLRNGR